MSKKMLINATLSGEERVAIVEDGLLTELDIEVAGSENTKGNIYKAEVIRIEPGLQAAFVNYGAERHGFLQIGDIHPDLWPQREGNNAQRPPINEILRRGQQLLVQVVKEERGTKGAAVTTELSLAGRYMVLMANSRSRGISRKIDKDSTRKKIKEALKEFDLPDDMGYIIRTAAIDQSPEELKRDFDYLFNIYQNIVSQAEKASAPALVYQESSLVLRSVRDYFTPDMDEVLIDDKEIFKQTRDFFKTVMPDHVKLVKLHQERRPIFARYQIEEQIVQLASNSVNLPSGGSIVLDQTEALVAIDVNSGKVSSEQSIESTACLVNVEAATEIARQLRLRDLGGLIVIDFIDMRQRKNARKVEKTLEQALKQDKARITQGRISSQFGLLEMSRQRIKPNLGASSYKSCPHCSGSGRIRSCESRAISLLRRIQAGTAKGKIERVVASVALDVGTMLLNQKRSELKELEQQQNIEIWIKPHPDHLPNQVDIDFIKDAGDSQDGNTEQKALVDMDYSERSLDNNTISESNGDKSADTKDSNSKEDNSGKERQDSGAQKNQNAKDQNETTSESQNKTAQGDNNNKPKRPRRSRPSRQRRPRNTAKSQEQSAEAGPATSQDEEKTQAANNSPAPDEVKKDISRTDKQAHSPAIQAANTQKMEEDKPSSADEAVPATQPSSDEKKNTRATSGRKPASGRTRRKKPATAEDTSTSATNNPQDNSQAASNKSEGTEAGEHSAPQNNPEQPAPKRTTRRSNAKKKAPEETSNVNEPQQKQADAAETAKPAPARKRAPARRRTQPKDNNDAATATPETPLADTDKNTSAADAENYKAPAPRKRTPRKRAPAQGKPDSTSETAALNADSTSETQKEQTEGSSVSAQEGNEVKKPAPARKRRAPVKKTAGTEDKTPTETEGETPAAAKTPRRRTTTRRSKTSAAAKASASTQEQTTIPASESATDESKTETKPAPKRPARRTTTRRSKSTPTSPPEDKGDQSPVSGSDSATQSTPDAAPKRRRPSARKTTAPKTEDDA